MFSIAEDLFLLALDEQKGIVATSGVLQYGLVGAVLADLALANRLDLGDKKVVVLDTAPVNDPVLDAALAAIAKSPRNRRLVYWMDALNGKRYRWQIPEGLVSKGVLRKEKKRFLGIVPYDAYPSQSSLARYQVKHRLRAVLLAGEAPQLRDLVLLRLIEACWLMNRVFTGDERKLAARRLKEMSKKDAIGKAVARAIKEIEAAAATAATAAAAS